MLNVSGVHITMQWDDAKRIDILWPLSFPVLYTHKLSVRWVQIVKGKYVNLCDLCTALEFFVCHWYLNIVANSII